MTNNNEEEIKKDLEHSKLDTESEIGLIPKSIKKSFIAHSQREGAGFIVNRPIGGGGLTDKESDPFLLLDELGPKIYEKGEFEGAPWHPHRGFDTVMYMKKGEGAHEDSMGTKGVLKEGDVQWMTAGNGIIHDEGKDHPGGELHGFQLWINLSKKNKMTDPQYQQITGKNFPFIELNKGVKVKCISGKVINNNNELLIESPLKPLTLIHYFDYNIDKNTNYQHVFDKNNNEFETIIIYVYGGKGQFYDGGKNNKWIDVQRKSTLLFSSDGQCIRLKSSDEEDLKFLLLAGKPIKEPIARYGPFVMNTEGEIRQAFIDYQNGKLATVKGKSFIY